MAPISVKDNGPFLVILDNSADDYPNAVEWLQDRGAIRFFDAVWVLPKYDGMAGDIAEGIRSVAASVPAVAILCPPDEADIALNHASAAIARRLPIMPANLRLVPGGD